jgi:putative DNA primase/helicase
MREGSGEEKFYLDVPFPDKEQVKALGARWDRHARSWYVPDDLDVEPFIHWLA